MCCITNNLNKKKKRQALAFWKIDQLEKRCTVAELNMFIVLLEPLKFMNHDIGRHRNEATLLLFTQYILKNSSKIYIFFFEIELLYSDMYTFLSEQFGDF